MATNDRTAANMNRDENQAPPIKRIRYTVTFTYWESLATEQDALRNQPPTSSSLEPNVILRKPTRVPMQYASPWTTITDRDKFKPSFPRHFSPKSSHNQSRDYFIRPHVRFLMRLPLSSPSRMCTCIPFKNKRIARSSGISKDASNSVAYGWRISA
jgi:hypothetical protein